MPTIIQNIFSGISSSKLIQRVVDSTKLAQYLTKYGYVPPSQTGSLMMPGGGMSEHMKNALLVMQGFLGVNQTGEIDEDTLELIGRPRCGVKDIFRHGEQADRDR